MTNSSGIRIIRWTLAGTGNCAARARLTSGFTSGRLLYYLAVLPVIVIAALLGIIFLAAFLVLSALAVLSLGIWFWRRRNRLRLIRASMGSWCSSRKAGLPGPTHKTVNR